RRAAGGLLTRFADFLEAVGFEGQKPLGGSAEQIRHESRECARVTDRKSRPASACDSVHAVAAGGFEARRPGHPGEAASILELGHFPLRGKEFRLLYFCAAPDAKFAAVEALNAFHARRPLGPALDISRYVPDTLRRRRNIDDCLEQLCGRICCDSGIFAAHRSVMVVCSSEFNSRLPPLAAPLN